MVEVPQVVTAGPYDPSEVRDIGGMMGLFDGAAKPLPLQKLRVRAELAGDCARTVVEQHFSNPYAALLDAIYIFPLPPGGAVTEMSLVAGLREIHAECRVREAAEAAFDQARAEGQLATLLTDERSDVFMLRIANLAPGADVTIRLAFVERLASADGRHSWRFPTVVAPRYLPGTPIGHEGPGILPDTDHVPDASRLQPPLRLAGGTALDLEVSLAGPVTDLTSSLHAVRQDAAGPAGLVRVAPAVTATLDRDFVLTYALGAADSADSRAWTDGRHTLLVIASPAVESAPVLPRDAVLVVDISGSMQGAKLVAAKRALHTVLHGLSGADRFRLIAFNDQLVTLTEDFRSVTDAEVAAADAWIDRLVADNGTEMLPAVRSALSGDTPAGRLRTVLFITDGQAWNEVELVAAVANRRRGARFFTLGIDTAVNMALLERLARIGGGTCTLCSPTDDIEETVATLEARFGSPIWDEVTVTGAEPADPDPRTVFARQSVSLLLAGAPERLIVHGRTPSGPVELMVAPLPIGLDLGPLWAREHVAYLEDRMALRPVEAEALRGEIERTALAHGIASLATAFVAVDTQTHATGERVTVVQPVELPYSWNGQPSSVNPGTVRYLRMSDHFSNESLYELSFMPGVQSPLPLRHRKLQAPTDGAGAMPQHSAAMPQPAASPGSPGLGVILAGSQSVDGSFAGDVEQTASSLAALVLLGNTRQRGSRRRTVAKAADWLQAQAADPRALLALALLADAEAGATPDELRSRYGERLRNELPTLAGLGPEVAL
jgi:Ca-activated chloride channel family protein